MKCVVEPLKTPLVVILSAYTKMDLFPFPLAKWYMSHNCGGMYLYAPVSSKVVWSIYSLDAPCIPHKHRRVALKVMKLVRETHPNICDLLNS